MSRTISRSLSSATSRLRAGFPWSSCAASRSHTPIASRSVGIAALALLSGAIEPACDTVSRSLQAELGLDRGDVAHRIDLAFDVNDVVVVEAAHHVGDRVDLANVRKKLVAEPLPFRRAAHQSRDVDEVDRRVGLLLGLVDLGELVETRGSGTGTTPTLGSIVQNGKFCASAFAFESALNSVLLPTFGSPTMPQEKPIESRSGAPPRARAGRPLALLSPTAHQFTHLPPSPGLVRRRATMQDRRARLQPKNGR